MEERQPLPPAPSLGTTFMDVFTSPSEVYQNLKGTASTPKLWVVPLIVSILMAILVTCIIATNESLHGQVIEQQRAALEKQVEKNKLTRESADIQMDRLEKSGTGMFIAFGSIFASIAIAAAFFIAALFLWLADKALLKSVEGYGKHLELYGISLWIGVLGGIITLLMIVGFNSLAASPSAVLAVLGNYETTNDFHKVLSALNIFSIWQAAIVGIGLSKFSGKPTGTGMAVAFGLWALWVAGSILLGLAR
jgi:uncharacterized Tic20 family protein